MEFHFLVLVDMPGADARSLTLTVDAPDMVHAHAEAFEQAAAAVSEKWPRAVALSVVECIRLGDPNG